MSKIKVQYAVSAKTVDDKDVLSDTGKPITLGSLLADHLSMSPAEKNIRKLYGWAKAAAKGEVLDLDTEDADILRTTIETLPRLNLAMKAQCLEILHNAMLQAANETKKNPEK